MGGVQHKNSDGHTIVYLEKWNISNGAEKNKYHPPIPNEQVRPKTVQQRQCISEEILTHKAMEILSTGSI